MIPVLPSTPRRRRSARLTHWCGRAQRGLKIVCRPPGTSCEACGRQQNRLLDEAWGDGARRTDCGVEGQDQGTSHQNALFGAKPLKRFSAPFVLEDGGEPAQMHPRPHDEVVERPADANETRGCAAAHSAAEPLLYSPATGRRSAAALLLAGLGLHLLGPLLLLLLGLLLLRLPLRWRRLARRRLRGRRSGLHGGAHGDGVDIDLLLGHRNA